MSTKKIRILTINATGNDSQRTQTALSKEDICFEINNLQDHHDLKKRLFQISPDIIISFGASAFTDIESALVLAGEIAPSTPFIVALDHIDKKDIIAFMKAGASDCVIGKDTASLLSTIKAAIEKRGALLRNEKAGFKLREREARYRLIHDNALYGIIITDETGAICETNPRARKMFGYQSDFLTGLKLFQLIPKLDLRLMDTMCQESSASCADIHPEFDGLKKDGGTFPCELTFYCFDIDDRRYITTTIRDITLRKKAEVDNKRIQSQLFQSQKMEAIGLLAGGVAHDFNNLLTGIRGHAGLAMMKSEKSAAGYKDMKQVDETAIRASKLTRQLLLFSKKQSIKIKELNLNQALTDIIEMIRHIIGESVEVKTDFQPDLQGVCADKNNIEQVIMNLAINSKDAMPEGGAFFIRTQNIAIDEMKQKSINHARIGDFVLLSVKDTGTGMTQKVISHAFEPFFSLKPLGKGTGMGLAVVYGIIKQHNGWINIESAPGAGARFDIYLPALEKKVQAPKKVAPEMNALKGDGQRILIVEGEQMVSQYADTALTENGYQVISASCAAQAQALIKKHKGAFDLLFIELKLPDTDGIALAENLMDKHDIPVLLTSADPNLNERKNAVRKYPFLQKPYHLSDLYTEVKKALTDAGD